jgi:AraC-like DNA-binding protein
MDQAVHQWVERVPAARLRPFVDRYVGYRMIGYAPGVHRGLPAAHMTFIVSIGRPIDVVAQTSPAQGPRAYGCVISGLAASPALIAHDGNQEGVAIELTPLGSRALLGMPAAEIWDLSLELSDVAGSIGVELWERLQIDRSWDQRFLTCDEVLGRMTGSGEVAADLRRSWHLLVASAGRLSVAELAAETGWTRQHLGRRFRQEFGLPPKLAARVLRFDRARRMLQSVPSYISISQVAAACGYFDQSHLCREFAELAGCSPTELVASENLPPPPEVPSVQDPGPVSSR